MTKRNRYRLSPTPLCGSAFGQGKSSSVRTLLAFQLDDKAFFIYGFSKNERANVSQKELKALKLLASELLGYSTEALEKAVQAGELIEVNING